MRALMARPSGESETPVDMQPIVGADRIQHRLHRQGPVFQGDAGDRRLGQLVVERHIGVAADGGGGGAALIGGGGLAAEPVLDPREAGMAGVVIVHDLADAIGAEAGMQVDEGRMADARSLPAQDLAQGPVGPDRRAAAIEHPLGIAVLARADGALESHGAMLLAIGLQRGIGRRLAVDPVAGADRLAQLVIGGVQRMRPRVIDEVAVEIDIVLVHATHPGKAAGVDGMDQKDGGAARHLRREPALQQPDLKPRAAEAFDAMGPRHDDQQALGVLWP